MATKKSISARRNVSIPARGEHKPHARPPCFKFAESRADNKSWPRDKPPDHRPAARMPRPSGSVGLWLAPGAQTFGSCTPAPVPTRTSVAPCPPTPTEVRSCGRHAAAALARPRGQGSGDPCTRGPGHPLLTPRPPRLAPPPWFSPLPRSGFAPCPGRGLSAFSLGKHLAKIVRSP
jgi:hypothetical protein